MSAQLDTMPTHVPWMGWTSGQRTDNQKQQVSRSPLVGGSRLYQSIDWGPFSDGDGYSSVGTLRNGLFSSSAPSVQGLSCLGYTDAGNIHHHHHTGPYSNFVRVVGMNIVSINFLTEIITIKSCKKHRGEILRHALSTTTFI